MGPITICVGELQNVVLNEEREDMRGKTDRGGSCG